MDCSKETQTVMSVLRRYVTFQELLSQEPSLPFHRKWTVQKRLRLLCQFCVHVPAIIRCFVINTVMWTIFKSIIKWYTEKCYANNLREVPIGNTYIRTTYTFTWHVLCVQRHSFIIHYLVLWNVYSEINISYLIFARSNVQQQTMHVETAICNNDPNPQQKYIMHAQVWSELNHKISYTSLLPAWTVWPVWNAFQ